MKNKTLDKFMTTRLEIKKTNVKTVHLPDGTAIEIPKMSYRHFVKIKTLKDDPVAIMRFIIDDIKPRELTAAEIEFVLSICMHTITLIMPIRLKKLG
ncbi:baseplate distal hub subunit [Klebsiella phage CPRSB]|nr:baseplate distal hub subunit [Klebsiella phage CPRSB]